MTSIDYFCRKIIMIDDITRIDFFKFSFGLNSVIICGDTDKALDKIKYLKICF